MNNERDEIYTTITKREILLLLCAGGALGFLVFAVCYGVAVLDVTNDGWLLQGGDLMQHYVGWKAYRASAWHFPIGMTDGLVYPDQSCVVYTDSIPLFAIFFKILSPLLPETFQYFGIWGAVTFILMGAVSAVILRKFTRSLPLCVIGSLFFSFSPYVIQRMFRHTALAGNWLILLAIAIWVYRPYFHSFKRKTFSWTGLLVTASLIHIYYIPMVMVFMIFACFQDLLENKGWQKDLVMGIVAIGVDLAVLYGVGAFSAPASMSDGGLGTYSSNLNTFFNPIGKGSFLPDLPICSSGQDEGYGYLGLGILLLLAAAVFCGMVGRIRKWIRKTGDLQERKRNSFRVSLFLAWTAFLLLALSPTVSVNQTVLFQIPWPGKILTLLSIFRSSGRFIWGACYLIMFYVIAAVMRHVRSQWGAAVCLAAAVCVQVLDLQAYARNTYALTVDNGRNDILVSSEWDRLAENKEHITCLPYNLIQLTRGTDAVYEVANYAIDHDLSVNYYWAARVDEEEMAEQEAQIRQALEEGEKDTDTLYLLDSEETGEAYGMTVEMVDGILVGYFE